MVRASLSTLAIALVCCVAAAPSAAETYPVACSVADLTADLALAEASAEPDTLSLTSGCTYSFTAPASFWFGPEAIAIGTDVTIEGNGATIARDPAAPPFRLFFVGADPADPRTVGYTTPGPGRLSLRDLTLSGGLARGGSSSGGGGGAGLGGAIFNQGTVTLRSVTVVGNGAIGGSSTGAGEVAGGGIGADAAAGLGGGFGGPITPLGAAGGAPFDDPVAIPPISNGGGGGGFAAGDAGQPATAGGPGSGGGATSGLGGAGKSATGTDVAGGNGSGGGGAAPATASAGGSFGEGVGDGGGGGVGGGGGSNAGGGFGGGGGAGTVATTAGGDGGFGGGGGARGAGTAPGDGGAAAGAGGATNGGGGAGLGGAIFNMQGSLSAVNATFTSNSATGGGSGDGTDGLGRGGAIFNLNGSVSLAFLTLAGNEALGGGRAFYDLAYDAANPRAATLALSGSILSSPTFGAAELRVDRPAAVASGGANQGTATATLTGGNIVRSSVAIGGQIVGQFRTADPQLGALAANGGPVRTMLPGAGSPALDAGGASCPATDARGVARPQAAACDLGAVELVRPPVVDPPPTGGPSPQPTPSSPPGASPPGSPGSKPPGSLGPKPSDPPAATKASPRPIGLAVRPRRDRKLPLRFKVSGRLRVPTGVKLAPACDGRMTVKLTRRAKTVAVRKPRLRLRAGRCVYSTRLALRTRKRIGKRAKRLTVTARFPGNAQLKARSARPVRVRVR